MESLSRPQSRSQSRLKLLMMKQSGTRMEDLLKKEEDEIVRAMEKHERTRLKWKEIYKEVTHVNIRIKISSMSLTASSDFFFFHF